MRRMWLLMEAVAEELGIPVPNAPERFTMTQYMLDNVLKVSMGDLPTISGESISSSPAIGAMNYPTQGNTARK